MFHCVNVRIKLCMYIDINAPTQGIKSFLASQSWSQAVAGARTHGTDSPEFPIQPR